MLFLVYIAVFFFIVALGVYLFMILRQKDEIRIVQKEVVHNIEETKTFIPDFEIPQLQIKKLKDNDRDSQFARSLQRIIPVDELREEENNDAIQENLTKDTAEKSEISVPVVNHSPTHVDYQDSLFFHENNSANEDNIDDLENLKKEKIKYLLQRAAEITKNSNVNNE